MCVCVGGVAMLLSLGNSATHASVLSLKCSWGGGCCQLPARAVLTLLQLSQPVVVLKESLTAEGVCEQHLQKNNSLHPPMVHVQCRIFRNAPKSQSWSSLAV